MHIILHIQKMLTYVNNNGKILNILLYWSYFPRNLKKEKIYTYFKNYNDLKKVTVFF